MRAPAALELSKANVFECLFLNLAELLFPAQAVDFVNERRVDDSYRSELG